jgi:predicted DNA-binding transcriptional regulator AlpA
VTTPTQDVVTALVEDLADVIAAKVIAVLRETVNVQAAEPWRLLDVGEVAMMLGRSPRWVHGAVKERGLPHVRLDGGALAFDPEAVRRWAEARSIPRQTPDPACTALAHPRFPGETGGERIHYPTAFSLQMGRFDP